MATSTGFLPVENRNKACVSLDLFLTSFVLSFWPSISRMIFPISVNETCAAWAISRMVLPSRWSLITSCSLSRLFNTGEIHRYYWLSLQIAFSAYYHLLLFWVWCYRLISTVILYCLISTTTIHVRYSFTLFMYAMTNGLKRSSLITV